jgi:imidazolonepropionase-like amidohydrolase
VRQNVFYSVDVIKVTTGNDISAPEMTAIVEEAQRQGLKVAVHAFSAASIQTAIDAGAASIEYGDDVTDEQLKQMRDKGIFLDLTPTCYGGFFIKIAEASIVMSPDFRSERANSAKRTHQQYASLVQRVLKSGVKFAAGSDMCWFYPAQKTLAMLDSHAAPASSWSDTEQRRGEIRRDTEQTLKELSQSQTN